MNKKWIGLAFAGAMGAGMVANLAYQNVVLGQVSAPVQLEGDGLPPPQEALGVARYNLSNENEFYRQGGIAHGAAIHIGQMNHLGQSESNEMMASELQVAKLLREFQNADESDRKDIVDQINVEVLKQFELRQAAREKELEELEEQLAKLKEKHQKRESMKDEIISARVNDLLNNLQGLGWGSEPMPMSSSPFLPTRRWGEETGLLPSVGTFRVAPGYYNSAPIGSPLAPVVPGAFPAMPAVPAMPVLPGSAGLPAQTGPTAPEAPAKSEGGQRDGAERAAKSPKGK